MEVGRLESRKNGSVNLQAVTELLIQVEAIKALQGACCSWKKFDYFALTA
jgi:hypothetical protein